MKTPLFIHVPKTGGTYLRQLESTSNPILNPMKDVGHSTICSEKDNSLNIFPPYPGLKSPPVYKGNISNYFVFSNVRNIFDWLVSYYFHSGGLNPKYVNTSHYDYENAQKGFEYLVKTIANRSGKIWPSRKLIHCQLFSDNGELIVDWINKTESLDNDLEEMANYCHAKYKKQAPQRVGRENDSYQKYYTPELIDLVNETWKYDLDLFGYSFIGNTPKKALLNKLVTPSQKERISYFWNTNELKIVND